MLHYYLTALTHGCLDRAVYTEVTDSGKYNYDPEMTGWLGMKTLLNQAAPDSAGAAFLRNIKLGDRDEVDRQIVVESSTGAIVDLSEVRDEEDEEDDDDSKSKKKKKTNGKKPANPNGKGKSKSPDDSDAEDDDYESDDSEDSDADSFIVSDEDEEATTPDHPAQSSPDRSAPRARKGVLMDDEEDDLSIDQEFFDKVVKSTGGRRKRPAIIDEDSNDQ